MHPTDNLVSFSHIRAAQAAAADCGTARGPKHATQPTALTDRQHLARIAQADPIAVHHSVGATILRLRTLAETDGGFAQRIAEL